MPDSCRLQFRHERHGGQLRVTVICSNQSETKRIDLIVSNPPFVIGSPVESQHDYRDSGLAGDDVCAALVRGAADHLNPGGWCQLLANWEITDGDDWSAHPRSWLSELHARCLGRAT